MASDIATRMARLNDYPAETAEIMKRQAQRRNRNWPVQRATLEGVQSVASGCRVSTFPELYRVEADVAKVSAHSELKEV